MGADLWSEDASVRLEQCLQTFQKDVYIQEVLSWFLSDRRPQHFSELP